MLDEDALTPKEYEFLKAYLEKFPDRVDVVSAVIRIHDIGPLSPELCEILKRNVNRVLVLSNVKTMNELQIDESLVVRRSSGEKTPIAQRVFELLKSSNGPLTLAVVAQKIGCRPATAITALTSARKLLKKDEKIICSSFSGMRSYEYRRLTK